MVTWSVRGTQEPSHSSINVTEICEVVSESIVIFRSVLWCWFNFGCYLHLVVSRRHGGSPSGQSKSPSSASSSCQTGEKKRSLQTFSKTKFVLKLKKSKFFHSENNFIWVVHPYEIQIRSCFEILSNRSKMAGFLHACPHEPYRSSIPILVIKSRFYQPSLWICL